MDHHLVDRDVVDPDIEQYALEHSRPEAEHLSALADETRSSTSAPSMMVGPLEGGFLAAVVALQQPRAVLEIGTFTGYSALSMAAALPPGGRITTCDINPDHVAIAQRHVDRSPFADRIDIRLGPALATLAELPGPFDLVFIDADKTGYLDYYEAVLPKLAPRGVILVDNVLWSGRVLADDEGTDRDQDPDTAALKIFNDHVVHDERVTVVMLTIRDGVSVIRRRD